MDIFRGLIQSPSCQDDDEITVLFPNGIVAGECAYAHWGNESSLTSMIRADKGEVGRIIPLGRSGDDATIGFSFDERRNFKAVLNRKSHTLTLALAGHDGSVVLSSDLQLVSGSVPTALDIFSDTVTVEHDLEDGKIYGCLLNDGQATVSDQLSFALGLIFGTVGISMAALGPGMPAVAGTAAGVGFAATSLVLPNAISWLPWDWLVEQKKAVAKQLNFGQLANRTTNFLNGQTLTVFWVETLQTESGRALEFRKVEQSYSDNTTVSLKELITNGPTVDVLARIYIPEGMDVMTRSLVRYTKKTPNLRTGSGFKAAENINKWPDNTIFQISESGFELNGYHYNGLCGNSLDSTFNLTYINDTDFECGELFQKSRKDDSSNGLLDVLTQSHGVQGFCQKNNCAIQLSDSRLQKPLQKCGDYKDVKIQIQKFVDQYGIENIAAISWEQISGDVTGYLNGDFGKVLRFARKTSLVFFPADNEVSYMTLEPKR